MGSIMTIRVGTASWTDKSLISSKRFYPRGCSSAEDRLRFYASQFSLVEVDSSYYAMPSAINAQLWVERTPGGFIFDIKAFRLMTGHQTSRDAFPKDLQVFLPDESGTKNIYYRKVPVDLREELWRRYREALEPLRRAGKLGAVLFQFAPWLTSAAEGWFQVEECLAHMEGYPIAAEFRNKSWLDERHRNATLKFERENSIVHVVVDAPLDVSNRAHTVWQVTNPALAIVRLHGRNAATWNIKGAVSSAQRFNYDYSEQELTALAEDIQALAEQVEQIHVVFNNNFEDQGQRNASTMMGILGAHATPRS